MLLRIPGVCPPQEDTWLLADALAAHPPGAHTRVLDLCTGTGALAVRAAQLGAGDVAAIDVSRPRRPHRPVQRAPAPAHDPGVAEYVPAENNRIPEAGIARAWDAGTDGRALLDRICAEAPDVLAPGGTLLSPSRH